jgi:hypothetical protein
VVKRKLTLYALELSMREWSTTKRMADEIDEGMEEEFEFDLDEGCTFGCELPVRYGLPCRHWMYNCLVEEVPLPLSLFHPRWLFDGLAILYNRWAMTWDLEQEVAPGPTLANRHAGDRYIRHGLQMAEDSALAILDKLKSLPPSLVESFASSFAAGAKRLLV